MISFGEIPTPAFVWGHTELGHNTLLVADLNQMIF